METLERTSEPRDRLLELGVQRGAAESALACQQLLIASEDPEDAKAARIEAARIRDEIALIDDQIAGIQEAKRRRAAQREEERKTSEFDRRRAAKRELANDMREWRKAALKLHTALRDLAALDAAVLCRAESILTKIRPYARDFADLRHDVLGTGFNDPKEMVARELASRGVFIPGLSSVKADELVSQRDMIGWHDWRAGLIEAAVHDSFPEEG